MIKQTISLLCLLAVSGCVGIERMDVQVQALNSRCLGLKDAQDTELMQEYGSGGTVTPSLSLPVLP